MIVAIPIVILNSRRDGISVLFLIVLMVGVYFTNHPLVYIKRSPAVYSLKPVLCERDFGCKFETKQDSCFYRNDSSSGLFKCR